MKITDAFKKKKKKSRLFAFVNRNVLETLWSLSEITLRNSVASKKKKKKKSTLFIA